MAKLIILDGDMPEVITDVPDERFVFLITKSGKVFHIDLSDENMHRANDDLENLGLSHQKIVRENLEVING